MAVMADSEIIAAAPLAAQKFEHGRFVRKMQRPGLGRF